MNHEVYEKAADAFFKTLKMCADLAVSFDRVDGVQEADVLHEMLEILDSHVWSNDETYNDGAITFDEYNRMKQTLTRVEITIRKHLREVYNVVTDIPVCPDEPLIDSTGEPSVPLVYANLFDICTYTHRPLERVPFDGDLSMNFLKELGKMNTTNRANNHADFMAGKITVETYSTNNQGYRLVEETIRRHMTMLNWKGCVDYVKGC